VSATVVAGTGWRLRRAALWAHILRSTVREAGSLRAGLAAARAIAAERDRWRGPGLPRKLVRGPDGRWFFSLHLPGYPSRAFDRMLTGTLARLAGDPRPPLQTLAWAITARCPLRCSHCSEIELLGEDEPLDDAALDDVLAALRARGLVQLQLSGGEPLRRLDRVEHVARAVAHETEVWVLTSGVGLNAEAAARLRAAGVTGVNVSLDHWERHAHDAFRRRAGVHAAAVDGIAAARQAGLLTALTLTLTRETAEPAFLARYLETAAELGVGFVRWLEPRAVGRWDGHDVALTPEQQRAVEVAYISANASDAALPLVEYPPADQRQGGCYGAGKTFAFVDARGRLHACPFCRDPVADVATGLDAGLARLAARGCHLERAATFPSRPRT